MVRIIATIGPSSNNKKILFELINNGVNTIRLNFSHFHEDEFIKVIQECKKISQDVKIMGDLCGKKVRVCESISNVFKVYQNEIVYFCSEDVYKLLSGYKGNVMKLIPLSLATKFIEENNIKNISMKDGTMKFEILDKDKVFLKARVCNTGVIRGGKGCNIPEVDLGEYILNEKDKKDVRWALENNIDIISQSYVENSKEVLEIKEYIKKVKGNTNNIKVFSKIETKRGLLNYKEILENSDGIVIARGDLVPECGLVSSVEEEFNLLYKIKEKNHKKEIIVATHLLDSMKSSTIATISEVESIYTFISIGVDGFLLAGETSIGKNPPKVVEFLKELIAIYNKS